MLLTASLLTSAEETKLNTIKASIHEEHTRAIGLVAFYNIWHGNRENLGILIVLGDYASPQVLATTN